MKDPWKKLFANVKSAVAVRPLRRTVRKDGTANIPYDPLDIDIDHIYLEQTFWKQDGKCYWFGNPIDPQNIFIARHPLAPSVDRLDDSKGYVKGNVVITTRFTNFGRNSYKGDFSQIVEEFKTGLQGGDNDERIRLQFGL